MAEDTPVERQNEEVDVESFAETYKGLDLEQKMENFQEDMVGKDAEVIKQIKLKEIFTENEMSALWGRLGRFIESKGSKETKEAWQELKKRGKESVADKTRKEVCNLGDEVGFWHEFAGVHWRHHQGRC